LRLSLSGRLFALMLTATILFYYLYSLLEARQRQGHAEAFRIGQQASPAMLPFVGGFQETLIAISSAQVVSAGSSVRPSRKQCEPPQRSVKLLPGSC